MGGEGCQGLKKKKRSTKKLTTEIERGVHKEEKGAVGDGWERETGRCQWQRKLEKETREEMRCPRS